MQQAHAGQGQTALPFDRQGAQQLVLSSLGCPVGIPTTQPVITNAADPGRETRQVQWSPAIQQGFQGLGQQDRAEGIHREAAFQMTAPQPGQPFLRL